ncbi:MAG TPA: alpha/beta hydrolase [Candidatus Limnocylindrales bacterium]
MWFNTGDGRKITYRLEGSGPMLVCHPGGPGFSGAELGDLGGLSGHRTLVLLDPRATGGSDPAPDYAPDSYAADIDELRAHLGVEQVDLLGFSHGAIVAIAYAARYPDRVHSLVLASGVAAFSDDVQAEMARWIELKLAEPWLADAVAALKEEESGEIADLGALWQREAPLYFSRWDERFRPQMVAAAEGAAGAPLVAFNADGFDVRGSLGDIRAPTLIITGRDDFICGPAAAAELQHGIADARTVLIDDAGHMTFVEQPDAFRTQVEAFLARGG